MARKRLAAIKEFSDLGSGFRVAALDLEIRGAGNLLGGEQSGTIDAVGFEMYMKLLEETIRELKGEDLEDDVRATVNLKVDFRLDETYVPDMNQRLMIYRRIAGARSEDEIGRIVDEVRDRYGPPPTAVLNLADFGRIRVLADALGVETIDRDGSTIVIKFRQKAKVDPMQRDRAGPGARRPAAAAAELAEARPEASRAGRPAEVADLQALAERCESPNAQQGRDTENSAKAVVVDGPRHGRRGDAGFTKAEILKAGARRPPRAGRSLR